MTTRNILLIPGDGIGSEVVAEARRVLEWAAVAAGVTFVFDEALLGGAAYDATSNPFPPETLAKAKAADAILLGAVGGPKWESLDYSLRPERGLLGIRKELDLFANLRPALCFPALADASTLKREVISGLDILIVRELTGDIYFGQPRGGTVENGHRVGRNTMIYADWEVTRIARVALDLARARGKKLCSVDKANVLETTEMWREEVQKLRDAEYTDIALSHMYVDNAAMQLVRNPRQFDVMVTGNIFGDILSDCAAMLTGSLGMLPSASLGAEKNGKRAALYEPVHGSAPDIAGKGVANPIATILSAAMLLRYSLSMHQQADAIEHAVASVLEQGLRTGDIMGGGVAGEQGGGEVKHILKKVGTHAMGDAIIRALESGITKTQRSGVYG
ncbi:MAG: 3-isopropylmalate dehydrogenase [Alphaproteobacteria bacterium]